MTQMATRTQHLARLDVDDLRRSFTNAAPFPHIVVDNFLDANDADAMLREHEDIDDGREWGKYIHYNERKLGLTKFQRMGPATQGVIDFLSSDLFIDWLHRLTGFKNLIVDPHLDGGGLHKIERDGYLNVHTDYLAHTTQPTWSRQLNLLVYLNKDWDPQWRGQLELWNQDMTACARKIEPIFNRAVIFRTTDISFHGHPDPLRCPPDRARRSLALYYFTDEGQRLTLQPTFYRARPWESAFKHSLVALDRAALRIYSIIKRLIGQFNR